MSETRLDRLEDEIRASLARLEPMIIRIDERLQHVADAAAVARIEALLPHLATKAEVAVLPSRTEMWVIMGVMMGGFAVILTALTFLQHWLK
jgi:hypothetical protein